MIDTVGVRFPISPTRKQLYSWVGTPKIFPDGTRKERYIQNVVLETGARVDCEYYPAYGVYKEPCLKIWFSVPKALFGENVNMIDCDEELQMAIDIANKHLATLSWLPEVDLRQGFLYRLDCAYNHQVGDSLPDYIGALFHLEYPRRETKPYYPHQGVLFYSKVSTTSFYDKYAESRLPQAKGILRHETCLRRNKHIGRRLGIEQPTLGDVRIEMNVSVLQRDLKILGIDDTITVNRDNALNLLIQEYGYNVGTTLYGHWLAKQSMTHEQILQTGAKRRTIQDRNKKIRDAGISLTSTQDTMPLPSLYIMQRRNEIA